MFCRGARHEVLRKLAVVTFEGSFRKEAELTAEKEKRHETKLALEGKVDKQECTGEHGQPPSLVGLPI